MVRLEELEALDLLVWLQNGVTAAHVAGTTQSTISRRAQRVLSTFQGRLIRDRELWRVRSPLFSLLNHQRQIHQRHRWMHRDRLRLNVPFWTRPLLRRAPLEGWILNPEQGPIVCDRPLELLRDHVVDACLVTPTQLSRELSDLALFDLYSTHIDLHLLGGAGVLDGEAPSPSAALDLFAHSRLELLPFLPSSCCASSRARFEALCREVGVPAPRPALPHSSAAAKVAFLTPVMALGLPDHRSLPLPIDWPYRESLAVLRSNADQPAVQALVERLHASVPKALASLVPGA